MGNLGRIRACRWGLLAGVGMLLAACSMGRYEHGPSYLAELTVDLEVNGQPVHLRRILECKTYESRPTRPFSQPPFPTYYAVTVRAFGQRLPDGSAIMMQTPYNCGGRLNFSGQKDPHEKFPPYAEGFKPFMAWTPNAEKPTTLEVYVSHEYFKHPKARVRVKNLYVSPPAKDAVADPPDEFEWFTGWVPEDEKNGWEGIKFRGLGVVTLRRDQWEGQYPELDSFLSKYSKSTFVGDENLPVAGIRARIALLRIFERAFPNLTYITNIRDKQDKKVADGIDLWSAAEDNSTYKLYSSPMAIDKLQASFESMQKDGLFVLYSNIALKDKIAIKLGDHDENVLTWGRVEYVIDSESKKIICIVPHSIELFARIGSPILHHVSSSGSGSK